MRIGPSGRKSGGIDQVLFQGRRGCPPEISRSFLAGAPEQSLFIGDKPLHRIVDQASAAVTRDGSIPEIITFTLRDAESCD